jgi:hypothetical protein
MVPGREQSPTATNYSIILTRVAICLWLSNSKALAAAFLASSSRPRSIRAKAQMQRWPATPGMHTNEFLQKPSLFNTLLHARRPERQLDNHQDDSGLVTKHPQAFLALGTASSRERTEKLGPKWHEMNQFPNSHGVSCLIAFGWGEQDR